jgi:hypothetical protein
LAAVFSEVYIYIFKLYNKAVTEDGGGWEWGVLA